MYFSSTHQSTVDSVSHLLHSFTFERQDINLNNDDDDRYGILLHANNSVYYYPHNIDGRLRVNNSPNAI